MKELLNLPAFISGKKGLSEKYEIITLDNSFHGRTLATIAATGQEKYQKQYCPLTPKFSKVPINDIAALENAINEHTCAVMLEPIQVKAALILPPWSTCALYAICATKRNTFNIRRGPVWARQNRQALRLSTLWRGTRYFYTCKGTRRRFSNRGSLCKGTGCRRFEPGDHGSTFGGNPLACSAGIAVLSTIINENLSDNAAEVGKYFFEKMEVIKKDYPIIKEVRGKGLMIGIEFSKPVAKIVNKKIFEKKYLLGTSGESILRILPPLSLQRKTWTA